MKKLIQPLLAIGLAGVVAAPVAFAQQLEEIIVTATKRETSLQDVPISVTAVMGEAILQGGFSDIEDLSAFIPNLQIRDGFTGQAMRIRGVGSDPGNEAFEQGVAQFHDGVYYGRDTLNQNLFFDMQRVEVVRGPQPTFAGQSATAGAINYISRKPGDQFEANVTVQYGSDEETSLELAVGGPLSDTFALRFSGRYYELDDAGYTDLVTGAPTGTKENTASRLIGVWTPTDRLDITFKAEHNDVFQIGTPNEHSRCELRPQFASAFIAFGFKDACAMDSLANGNNLNVLDGVYASGGANDLWDAAEAIDLALGLAPGDPNGWTPLPAVPGPPVPGTSPVPRGLNDVREYNIPQEREHTSDVFLVDLNWQLGDYTLSSITSYAAYDKHDWLDPDHTSFAIFSDERSEDFNQTAQELRLSSPLDQTFSWMVGAYYQQADNDLSLDIFLPHAAGPPIRAVPPEPGAIAMSDGVDLTEEATWTSVFFSSTWNLTETVRLNLGGRYQDIQKDGVQTLSGASLFAGETSFYANGRGRTFATPVAVESNTDEFLPEVSIQWDANDNIMLYARYAEAVLAGGFVITPPIFQNQTQTYLPEFSEGFEVGLKGRFADGTVELNVTLYDVDFTDFQTSSFDRQTSAFVTTNAGAAHTSGIEFDGRWAVSENFTLGFGGAINEAEYDVFLDGCSNTLLIKQFELANPGEDCFVDLAGQSLPNSPEWEFVLSPTYDFNIGDYGAVISANMVFRDDIHLNDSFDGVSSYDPLNSLVGSSHRIDLRLAISPPDGSWEVALYGRDVTDERVQTGGAFDLVQRSTDPNVYDGGGVQRERGARWGLQGSYFFGN